MPLQRLTLGLLADLRPVHLGAGAFLLRQLEAFGADRIDEREIVADTEILEIFRLLLPPALESERLDHAGDPLAEFDQGLPRPLQFRPDDFGEEGVASMISEPEALDRRFAEGSREDNDRARRHILRLQQTAAGSEAAFDFPLVHRRPDDRTASVKKEDGDLRLLVRDRVHHIVDGNAVLGDFVSLVGPFERRHLERDDVVPALVCFDHLVARIGSQALDVAEQKIVGIVRFDPEAVAGIEEKNDVAFLHGGEERLEPLVEIALATQFLRKT